MSIYIVVSLATGLKGGTGNAEMRWKPFRFWVDQRGTDRGRHKGDVKDLGDTGDRRARLYCIHTVMTHNSYDVMRCSSSKALYVPEPVLKNKVHPYLSMGNLYNLLNL